MQGKPRLKKSDSDQAKNIAGGVFEGAEEKEEEEEEGGEIENGRE